MKRGQMLASDYPYVAKKETCKDDKKGKVFVKKLHYIEKGADAIRSSID